MLAAFNLTNSLICDPVDRAMPLNFNERTRQILDGKFNHLQEDLDNLKMFANEKLLRIKEKKTNVIKFNFSRNYDFPPELSIGGFNEKLDVTSETKLLGIIITNDLKWTGNTEYICKKAYKKMWTLRRMKVLDVDPSVILDVYLKEIRSVLELAVPAWHSGLTQKHTADIERVQRVAVAIILSDCMTGKCEYSYDMGLVILNIEPLDVRREKLCQTFAKKTLKSKHSDMFKKNYNQHYTRNKTDYLVTNCNTKRFFNSPKNYLTRLLNSEK